MSEYTSRFDDCDAVPIKVNRVFDSCSDKDCMTGVQVTLDTPLPHNATIVKTKCITVSDVCMNVEPIAFNKGFYSVDITFTFDVKILSYEKACCEPVCIDGVASVSKNCILYGSETNSKTFSSDGSVIGETGDCCNTINPPVALVQAVSPLVLESKISTNCYGREYEAEAEPTSLKRCVLLTIGLFYVVELVRPVTIMVPAYNYTIPEKECCADTDSPCEVFNKIKFPVEEFSPARLENSDCGCGFPMEHFEHMDHRIVSDNCDCQDI
jgi:hypothetical protein